MPWFDDYLQICSLSHGYNGNVYLARKQDQKYAIKVLLFANKLSNKDKEKYNKYCEEFNLSHALQHKNIVRCYDTRIIKCSNSIYSDFSELCLIMEYCNNGNLEDYLNKYKSTINEAKAIEFLRQICEGYKYLYDCHIMHRDMKTTNIVVHEQEDHSIILKITDFGESKKMGGTQMTEEKTASLKGTPNYMAPEVLEGANKNYNYQSDIYSIGVIFYYMLFSTYPFIGENITDLLQNIQIGEIRFDTLSRKISKQSITFILQCLQFDPTKRLHAGIILNHSVFKLQDRIPDDYIAGKIIQDNINRFQ